MPKYLTRVELHGARAEDYEALHSAMEALKFRRLIAAADGSVYQLPTAEYASHGEITLAEVRQLATNAASKTGRAFWILVVEYSAAAWTLPLVSSPRH